MKPIYDEEYTQIFHDLGVELWIVTWSLEEISMLPVQS